MKPANAAAAPADPPAVSPPPAAVRAFEQPDGQLDRLYEIAARDQWTTAELDFAALDLGAYPLPLRRAAADAAAQLHHGEVTAMRTAARLLDRLPSHPLRLLCATQVADEARHARFFEALLARLGCEGRVRETVRALMHEVHACDSVEGAMLGMQVLIEGVAHSLFLEGARAFAALAAGDARAPHLGAVRTLVCDWLPNLLARDESRHIAFGLYFLRRRLPELDRAARHALEARVERWGEMVWAMAREPEVIDGVGLDGAAVGGRCVADLNHRLARIGLAARIAAPAPVAG